MQQIYRSDLFDIFQMMKKLVSSNSASSYEIIFVRINPRNQPNQSLTQ